MEIQDWGGGLTQHEVEAIEKIKQAFQASENNKKVKASRNRLHAVFNRFYLLLFIYLPFRMKPAAPMLNGFHAPTLLFCNIVSGYLHERRRSFAI